MFGMFPLGMGNMISFTSFTSFTSSTDGINGFNVTNGYSGFFDPSQINNNMNGLNFLDQIQSVVTSVLNNVDIEKFAEEYYTAISDNEEENSIEDHCDFINFERKNDMYILRIELKGISLRELSIRYDPGIIDINLKRLENDNNSYRNNNIVKKKYNTSFDNIEEIDTDRVLKSIDNGVLIMSMPKKYVLDSSSKIIEVEDYTVDNKKDTFIKKI